MVTAQEIREQLSVRFTLTPLPDKTRGSAPSEPFLVDGGPAKVGIIPSVSAPLLRGLRPGPADVGRPGSQLSVRQG